MAHRCCAWRCLLMCLVALSQSIGAQLSRAPGRDAFIYASLAPTVSSPAPTSSPDMPTTNDADSSDAQGNPLSRGETIGVVIFSNIALLCCCLAYGMRMRFQSVKQFAHLRPREEITGYTATANMLNDDVQMDEASQQDVEIDGASQQDLRVDDASQQDVRVDEVSRQDVQIDGASQSRSREESAHDVANASSLNDRSSDRGEQGRTIELEHSSANDESPQSAQPLSAEDT